MLSVFVVWIMEIKVFAIFLVTLSSVVAQNYRVCIPSTETRICQSIERDGSQAVCHSVASRIDCALALARGQAHIGYFSEEEVLLLAQQQPNDHRVVASVRDASRLEPYAFEAVAIVPSTHTGGLNGLRDGRYCHPGLDQTNVRWTPRVLKALEVAAAQTDRAPADTDMTSRTTDHLETETLNNFFSSACRPGAWSANTTLDTQLKSQFPQICSLCGTNGCAGYNIDMGVNIAGVRNDNRHIQALECMRVNSNSTAPTVAYVAWLHVREYFTLRNPELVSVYSLLCPDGSLVPLSTAISNTTAACAFVRQPWGAIVANTNLASEILTNIRNWWPSGSNPGGETWQATAFTALANGGGSSAVVVFQDTPIAVSNYTSSIRTVPNIDATSTSGPFRSQRWCTISDIEQSKCLWLRASAHSLGITPTIACQQRASILDCLKDIRDNVADLIASPSNYGYIARQHFKLTPMKMVQTRSTVATRIAAFVKESSARVNITRFENLKGAKACFPEYGGLAYVAFVRAGQEIGVLSSSECDYARAAGEFFSGACAPGAVDNSHQLSDSNFNASILCSTCKSAVPVNVVNGEQTCSWDYTNMYYGNNGSLSCLTDPESDVAFLNTQNITAYLTQLNIQPTSLRALCRNNTLAQRSGTDIDDNCLLAYVVDAEILTRRNEPFYNTLNVLLDTLERYFGYSASFSTQLIDFDIFSPFDGQLNLLFRDSAIGFTEPTTDSTHEQAKNYIELFRHLNACTGAAAPSGMASKGVFSILSLIVLSMVTFLLN